MTQQIQCSLVQLAAKHNPLAMNVPACVLLEKDAKGLDRSSWRERPVAEPRAQPRCELIILFLFVFFKTLRDFLLLLLSHSMYSEGCHFVWGAGRGAAGPGAAAGRCSGAARFSQGLSDKVAILGSSLFLPPSPGPSRIHLQSPSFRCHFNLPPS